MEFLFDLCLADPVNLRCDHFLIERGQLLLDVFLQVELAEVEDRLQDVQEGFILILEDITHLSYKHFNRLVQQLWVLHAHCFLA